VPVSQTVEEILGRCQLFARVHAERRGRLAEFSLLRKFRKGQMVFRQGDPCPGVFVVGHGAVRVFKTSPSGKEHVLHMVGPGETFAEVAAIGGFPCPAYAEAVAPTTCALIPYDRFRKQMAEDHPLCLEMMAGLSYWVRHLLALLEDLVLRDATGRIARFLLETQPGADGTVKLPGLKRHVASHLNLTSETFSRTLSRLIEAGLVIDLENNRIRLVDRKRLQAMSEGLFPQV
jgi:CRP/FNR family transcriptional regulator, dissimilatory nitrate respiration regulator